ncbi:MAG: transcriptional repressor [Mycobacterium sp.]|nr:transcriptional repressor [Mycobacterium sp.]
MRTAGPPRQHHRRTTKRDAVVQQLARSTHFRSAQQLHHDMWHCQTVKTGLTTTYRILRALTDENIAETQRAEDGEILYRLRRTTKPRHHLICRKCGRAIDFTAGELEIAANRLAQQHRYTAVSHHLDLYGTCPQCRSIADQTAAADLR